MRSSHSFGLRNPKEDSRESESTFGTLTNTGAGNATFEVGMAQCSNTSEADHMTDFQACHVYQSVRGSPKKAYLYSKTF